MNSKIIPVLLIALVVLVAGCAQQGDQKTADKKASGRVAGGSGAVPASPVIVKDQAIKDGAVTVEKVVSEGDGWIVIHAQLEGEKAPGASIGYAAVKSGENKNVVVKVDESKATTVLYAMLHKDKGKVGTLEYPGVDTPVTVGDVVGEPVAPSFKVSK